jgi:TatA/E family protein of Tat protein translocase
MPFGVHGVDLIVVLAIALLIFGPKKLPEMGASIGKSIKEFKKGMNELTAPTLKDESPATYETVRREPVIANYMAPEPVVESHIVDEPVGEIHEKPTSSDFVHETKETETHAQ